MTIKRNTKILFTAIGVAIVSIAVMAGWIWKIDILLRVFSDAPTMKFNTALLLCLSALGIISLLQQNKISRTGTAFFAIVVIFLSFITFMQYIFKVDLVLDNYFIPDTSKIEYPGRMARTTAICFSLFGLALLASITGKKKYKKIANYSLALVALISILAILTFAMQTVTSSRVLLFNSMAFHTAICFFLLSLSLSLTKKKNTYVDLFSGVRVGSKLARRMMPVIIILPLLLGFVMLYITGTIGVNTELGITIYTLLFAFFGLIYASWMALSLNREDMQRRELERSLFQSNRELKENIRFKKQLVRTTPESILIINLNSLKVRYINKDIDPDIGLTKKRFLGINIEEIIPYVHPRDRQKMLEFHKALLKSQDNDIHDMELRLKLKGNEWEWFSVRGKIFERRDKTWVNEYVLLVRNISTFKETQKALLNAEKFSILGEVAKTLAHELRNPIASIKMATELIGNKVQDKENIEIEKYLKILDRSTGTLNDLVTSLLNSSNYSETVLKTTDLVKIIGNALDRAADRIYLAGIEIHKNYSGPHMVMADSEKLEIAILNIIVNASEATRPEEGIIDINIERKNSDVILSISDNGTGIEQEQLTRLFDAFYTTKETGVGVGLNSVKNILDEHDAKIQVNSKKNEGTTFMIYFPVH